MPGENANLEEIRRRAQECAIRLLSGNLVVPVPWHATGCRAEVTPEMPLFDQYEELAVSAPEWASSQWEPHQEISAYHEAGHCVVLACLGVHVANVCIVWDEECGLSARVSIPNEPALTAPQWAVSICAGWAAEKKRFLSKPLTTLLQEWNSLLAEHQDALALDEALARAQAILDDDTNWARVVAVAEALLARRTLSGEQVEEIISRTSA
jgi:ATP-dependent Zn protease